ncbi:MAG TPA: CPBP family intramembrane glutamic endopeptidase [Candidatus Dormibacteraeota bacterium]|nr:CPBP family intramembrane glutamic endopeptidase [Candidatus Dormibacteraeota bacterium]
MRRRAGPRVWLALATLPIAAFLFANSFVFSRREFWIAMASGVLVLAMFAALVRGPALYAERTDGLDVAIGFGSFAGLYATFWVGDKLIRLVRPVSGNEISAIYELRSQAPLALIAVLLVFVIGPGEELYWRGLVNWALGSRFGDGTAVLAGTALYGAVHLVTGNASIILAAVVAGFAWSMIYAVRRRLFPVIVSHVLFDLFLFVLAPVG